jgi:phosphopantothenoylcysteine synthetase/decarboxylase
MLTDNQPKALMCEKLVIAVTGSVGAALSLPAFLLLSRRLFARENRVLLSLSGSRFISPYVAQMFSGAPVITDMFDCAEFCVPHIEATRGAELLLVMPATANIIGKVAHGIADDLVSTAVLAAPCPVVFAPNMNEVMWTKPAVVRNVGILQEMGHHVIPPTMGFEISTMEETFGGMPSPQEILKRLVDILITSRGTRANNEAVNRHGR